MVERLQVARELINLQCNHDNFSKTQIQRSCDRISQWRQDMKDHLSPLYRDMQNLLSKSKEGEVIDFSSLEEGIDTVEKICNRYAKEEEEITSLSKLDLSKITKEQASAFLETIETAIDETKFQTTTETHKTQILLQQDLAIVEGIRKMSERFLKQQERSIQAQVR